MRRLEWSLNEVAEHIQLYVSGRNITFNIQAETFHCTIHSFFKNPYDKGN